jgi:hypothetical protein
LSESDKLTNPTDPRVALETMWALAPKYAQAKANRVYMEEFRKSLKAILMRSSKLPSIGAQERDAYAHPDYQVHLKGLQAAVEAEETMRWRLVAAQAGIEVWRSQEASNRNMDRGTA